MTNTAPIYNIMILEDISAVANRLRESLQSWQQGRVLPLCATIEQALAMVHREHIDILIADLKLPDGIGTTVIRELKATQEHAHVIVMTVLNDGPVVLDAIRAGATGYVLKDDTSFGLISAIEMVLDGRSPMSAAIARLIVNSLHAQPQEGFISETAPDTTKVPELTKRETDVLTAVAQGYSHKEVAEMLGISYLTFPK